VSNRIGNPQQINGSGTIGALLTVAPGGWVRFLSGTVIYQATLSSGSRAVVVDFRDTASNLIWRSKATALVLAGQQVFFSIASRLEGGSNIELRTLQQITQTGLGVTDELDAIRSDVDSNFFPMIQNMALPDGFSLPAGATMRVFDGSNIDPADTAQTTVVVTL
jgi:hypothetical protein